MADRTDTLPPPDLQQAHDDPMYGVTPRDYYAADTVRRLLAERDAQVAALTAEVGLLTDVLIAEKLQVAALQAERDAFKSTLHDELDANLCLRELGGARPDEGMTAYIKRVIAERDALRADAERHRFVRDAERSDGIADELFMYTMESLDRCVDEAMQREAKNAAIDAARAAKGAAR